VCGLREGSRHRDAQRVSTSLVREAEAQAWNANPAVPRYLVTVRGARANRLCRGTDGRRLLRRLRPAPTAPRARALLSRTSTARAALPHPPCVWPAQVVSLPSEQVLAVGNGVEHRHARFAELIAREESALSSGLFVSRRPRAIRRRTSCSARPSPRIRRGVHSRPDRYFQVDATGVFSTPLLPLGGDATSYGVFRRGASNSGRALQDRIMQILSEKHRLAFPRTAPGPRSWALSWGAVSDAAKAKDDATGKVAQDRSNSRCLAAQPPAGRRENAPNDRPGFLRRAGRNARSRTRSRRDRPRVAEAGRGPEARTPRDTMPSAKRNCDAMAGGKESDAPRDQRATRKEQSAIRRRPSPRKQRAAPAPAVVVAQHGACSRAISIRSRSACSTGGQFVLFRNAWRDGQRYIQGHADRAASIPSPNCAAATVRGVRARATSDLVVTIRDVCCRSTTRRAEGATRRARAPSSGHAAYQTRLSRAAQRPRALSSACVKLPPGPGAGTGQLVRRDPRDRCCAAASSTSCTASARGQIELTRQQQDFRIGG
jgi:hypothetical protein